MALTTKWTLWQIPVQMKIEIAYPQDIICRFFISSDQ